MTNISDQNKFERNRIVPGNWNIKYDKCKREYFSTVTNAIVAEYLSVKNFERYMKDFPF